MRSQSTKQPNCPKRGKNVGDQVVIGFEFAPDWLASFWTNHKAK